MSTADAFTALIGPQRPRNPERVTEDADYLLMLYRLVRALEYRAISNPEILPQIVKLGDRVREVVNVAVAVNAERYALDETLGASMRECARALGISAPSALDRKRQGERVIAERLAAAGAVKFSEAKRERAAVDAAAEIARDELAEYRARHAAA